MFATALAETAASAPHAGFVSLAANPVFLVKDDDIRGERAYYFIRIDRRKLHAFLRDSQNGRSITLSDYGEILFSAYGEHPSPYVEAYMREHYGWEG